MAKQIIESLLCDTDLLKHPSLFFTFYYLLLSFGVPHEVVLHNSFPASKNVCYYSLGVLYYRASRIKVSPHFAKGREMWQEKLPSENLSGELKDKVCLVEMPIPIPCISQIESLEKIFSPESLSYIIFTMSRYYHFLHLTNDEIEAERD